MILEVSKLNKHEQKKSEPDNRYSVIFQGKKLQPCKEMIYWYRWGEYTFDIRELRKSFGKKACRAIDDDFKIHPCTRFQKISNEVIGMVGSIPFKEVFDRK